MEVLSSFYPDMATTNNLIPRMFGCVSFVHVHSTDRGKLDPMALRCVFVGYKCFHPPSKKFFVSRDVTIHEQESYFSQPHLQGENLREEDEPLMFPNLTFGPEDGKDEDRTADQTEPAPATVEAESAPATVEAGPK